MPIKPKDLAEKRFGRLVAIEISHRASRCIYWLCKCDCGNEVRVRSRNLLRGDTHSCGCLKIDMWRELHLVPDKSVIKLNCIIRQYKRGAKTRNLEFSLTRDEVANLIFSNCFYCNTPPSNLCNTNIKRGETLIYNGIDRVDSGIGYITENVVSCCKRCNTAKMASSTDEFLSWIRKVYDHSIVAR